MPAPPENLRVKARLGRQIVLEGVSLPARLSVAGTVDAVPFDLDLELQGTGGWTVTRLEIPTGPITVETMRSLPLATIVDAALRIAAGFFGTPCLTAEGCWRQDPVPREELPAAALAAGKQTRMLRRARVDHGERAAAAASAYNAAKKRGEPVGAAVRERLGCSRRGADEAIRRAKAAGLIPG